MFSLAGVSTAGSAQRWVGGPGHPLISSCFPQVDSAGVGQEPLTPGSQKKTDHCEEKLYTILIMIFIWKYSNLFSTQRNQGNSKTASELPTPAIQLQILGICAER